MTLMEAGWNFNHQKSLLRLLRNRGVLALLPVHRKVELARFFAGSQLWVSDFFRGSALHKRVLHCASLLAASCGCALLPAWLAGSMHGRQAAASGQRELDSRRVGGAAALPASGRLMLLFPSFLACFQPDARAGAGSHSPLPVLAPHRLHPSCLHHPRRATA